MSIRYLLSIAVATSVAVAVSLLYAGELAARGRVPIEPSRIYIYDGDTIIVDKQRMRILDIDAPEISESRCRAEAEQGYRARDQLRAIVAAARTVEIVDGGERDRYDRPLIHLLIDGADAGRLLIRVGLAVEWRPGSRAWSERRRHWCGF